MILTGMEEFDALSEEGSSFKDLSLDFAREEELDL